MGIEVKITSLGHEGEGVGRVNGMATFVPGALPGETVIVEISEKKKTFQRGLLSEVVERSPHRIDAPCKVFEDCGGCQLQHLTYDLTLEWKRNRVRETLERIGKLQGVTVHPVLGMAEPWRYRNKVQLQCAGIGDKLALGYFSSKTKRLVPYTDCLLLPGLFNNLKDSIVQFLNQYCTKAQPEQLVMRYSPETGEVMLGIVGDLPVLPWKKVLDKFPQVKSIVQFNPRSKKVKILAGTDTISDKIFGNDFILSFQSFAQVNPIQTEILYTKAMEYAALSGKENVVDVYCGIGTITLALAARAKNAIGVEIVEQAIVNARENAKLNGVTNVQYYAAPAEQVLPQLVAQGVRADVVVVDPPRAGCDKEALAAIVKMSPERIVYVSCDPATLARDLGLLQELGYSTREVQPVDMFPWTAHVECVALIEQV